jgi:beta-ribofuranosylaminobenzene 5'-phosphate synthase
MNDILYYTVPARIHISLYDMNGNLWRINGGIGFAINEPNLKFQVEKSDKICINLIGKTYQVSYMNDLLKFIMSKFNIGGVKLTLYSLIPEHCWFGSWTITKLAISKAYLDLYDKNISFSELALILKRG